MPRPVPRWGTGAAVDLGTTTVVARLYDLATGRLLRRAETVNPQTRVAADVLGRISAVRDGRLGELRDQARGAIRACLGGASADEAVVVGNTTMLCLLAGHDPSSFATAPFVADRLFGETVSMDGVRVRLPRCAHAFFGADAVAAVEMSGLCACEGTAVLADIGTNGELALWRGDRRELVVASVAAGPAFERAAVCGSDLVAALADALASGAVDGTGQAVGRLPDGVTQADVRAVQLAKAAICAGLRRLLKETQTDVASVSRFLLVGGFGSALDPVKAVRIGLFPEAWLPVVRVCGNLAIEGASAALLDPAFGDRADARSRVLRYLDLGGNDAFAADFISEMRF